MIDENDLDSRIACLKKEIQGAEAYEAHARNMKMNLDESLTFYINTERHWARQQQNLRLELDALQAVTALGVSYRDDWILNEKLIND